MKLRAFIAAAWLLLAACGGGGPVLVAGDLARIMPSAADAPAGTQLDTENVGPKPLDDFVTDASVKSELSKLGFRVAYVAAFPTPNYVPDPEKAPDGSALYASVAVLLEDADAAQRAFTFYEERLKTRAKDLAPILIQEEIGDEVFAFRFSSLDDTPLPGLAILWRVGNGVFSILGVGNPGPDPDVTRALATKIDRRAKSG